MAASLTKFAFEMPDMELWGCKDSQRRFEMGILGLAFNCHALKLIADLPSQPQEYIGDRIVNGFSGGALEHNGGMK